MANLLKERYDNLVATWVALPEERRESLLGDFVLDYVYNSEKIENDELTFATVSQIIKDDSVKDYTGDVQVLIETRNLKTSWDLARTRLAEDPRLSEELIQEAQGLVTMGTYKEKLLLAGERPGTFKLENYVGGPASIGIPAVEVPREVGVLADDVNSYLEEGRRHLTIAAYLHARLFEIHPFADGNGRTARLLMNGVLLAMGMPPIVIRSQDHGAYHAALDVFHLEGDISPFRRFLRNETLLTWEGLID
ncbi:Fic family protein [Thermophilibacter provencensis]|uniref:Fic family protein n=1 Tax=Thermophilibacter provencensis TaxID=1852386 RepID=A0ABT7V5J3_9ACTN|nr:Fic family protein [Thermophilibacter provencensis]MDM8271224.1 Fic family protein [Thermophilibacter provencensis]